MDQVLTRVCPHCQEGRTFTARKEWATWDCQECGLGLRLNSEAHDDISNVGTPPHEPPITRRQTAELPAEMAADLLEACRCYSFMAYRGAALLARRAVEQAVVMLGVPLTRRTLQQKLSWLMDEGHLPKQWRSHAETIRDVGNAATHGAAGITRDEADAVVRAALSVVKVLMGQARTSS